MTKPGISYENSCTMNLTIMLKVSAESGLVKNDPRPLRTPLGFIASWEIWTKIHQCTRGLGKSQIKDIFALKSHLAVIGMGKEIMSRRHWHFPKLSSFDNSIMLHGSL